jgi:hypothetical protein
LYVHANNQSGSNNELRAAVESWRRLYQAGPLTEKEAQLWTDGYFPTYFLKAGILDDDVGKKHNVRPASACAAASSAAWMLS